MCLVETPTKSWSPQMVWGLGSIRAWWTCFHQPHIQINYVTGLSLRLGSLVCTRLCRMQFVTVSHYGVMLHVSTHPYINISPKYNSKWSELSKLIQIFCKIISLKLLSHSFPTFQDCLNFKYQTSFSKLFRKFFYAEAREKWWKIWQLY